jgi:regulator of G-protein signaling
LKCIKKSFKIFGRKENMNTQKNISCFRVKRSPPMHLRPTQDDIYSWSESFEKLMQSQAGRYYFREFLRSEYSEENMLFWMACEELKSELSPEAIEEKARIVYEDYISILSPREVSLDSRVREVINRNMVDPSQHTFDEAQLQIYTLMHRDSYPRFLNSRLYKKLCSSENQN